MSHVLHKCVCMVKDNNCKRMTQDKGWGVALLSNSMVGMSGVLSSIRESVDSLCRDAHFFFSVNDLQPKSKA